jgi:glycosyltransferase involved in cell wall biosynthesis
MRAWQGLSATSRADTSRAHKALVVMPARDEEATIREVLGEIKAGHFPVDILVVDDGSTDRTAEVAAEEGAQVISHEWNLGVAAVIQTGRIYALSRGYDFIAFCDADGQHNPSDIGVILSPLLRGEADFVIGSRELGRYIGKDPLLYKLPRHFCSFVISLLVRKRITDPTSGFKGWNRRMIEHLKAVYETSEKLHLSTTNDMEEILLANKAHTTIIEVPVEMRDRQAGVSKVYTTGTIFLFLTVFPWHLIRTVWRNLW